MPHPIFAFGILVERMAPWLGIRPDLGPDILPYLTPRATVQGVVEPDPIRTRPGEDIVVSPRIGPNVATFQLVIRRPALPV